MSGGDFLIIVLIFSVISAGIAPWWVYARLVAIEERLKAIETKGRAA